jgi:hypothetical protein
MEYEEKNPDYKLYYEATSKREEQLTIDISKFKHELADLLDYDGELSDEALLDAAQEEVEFADEADEKLWAVASYLELGTVDTFSTIGAISWLKSNMLTIGFALGIVCSSVLDLLIK